VKLIRPEFLGDRGDNIWRDRSLALGITSSLTHGAASGSRQTMSTRICPWWLTYTLDNPIRRLLHDPVKIVGPHVRDGMRVADVGCGMGYFTRTLAALVGPKGHVQAVDLQPEQLARVRDRCQRAGVVDRVELTQARSDALGLKPALDFVLAFWMVHEVPDAGRFFTEIKTSLAPGGVMLIAEPKMHVSAESFAAMVEVCRKLGFSTAPVSNVTISRSVLLSVSP
jgi:ubiquinone/menaquinone biosynthesis C-methylase UbiE